MNQTKILPFSKPKEVEKLLAEGWQLQGVFNHNTKAFLILKK